MGYTTDSKDPRLSNTDERHLQEVYLVLSEEERAKGFVQPVRQSYIHVGIRPQGETRKLTPEEHERYDKYGYVLFEPDPDSESGRTGRFWTEERLNSGCGEITTMGLPLAETYARDPKFYGATYCAVCQDHFPLEQFTWVGTDNLRLG